MTEQQDLVISFEGAMWEEHVRTHSGFDGTRAYGVTVHVVGGKVIGCVWYRVLGQWSKLLPEQVLKGPAKVGMLVNQASRLLNDETVRQQIFGNPDHKGAAEELLRNCREQAAPRPTEKDRPPTAALLKAVKADMEKDKE